MPRGGVGCRERHIGTQKGTANYRVIVLILIEPLHVEAGQRPTFLDGARLLRERGIVWTRKRGEQVGKRIPRWEGGTTEKKRRGKGGKKEKRAVGEKNGLTSNVPMISLVIFLRRAHSFLVLVRSSCTHCQKRERAGRGCVRERERERIVRANRGGRGGGGGGGGGGGKR